MRLPLALGLGCTPQAIKAALEAPSGDRWMYVLGVHDRLMPSYDGIYYHWCVYGMVEARRCNISQ